MGLSMVGAALRTAECERIDELASLRSGLDGVKDLWRRMNVRFDLDEVEGYIFLNDIRAAECGMGSGSAAMQALVMYADLTGKPIVLTARDSFGQTTGGRIVKFFWGFGFSLNTGRNKDFRFRGNMYRRARKCSSQTKVS